MNLFTLYLCVLCVCAISIMLGYTDFILRLSYPLTVRVGAYLENLSNFQGFYFVSMLSQLVDSRHFTRVWTRAIQIVHTSQVRHTCCSSCHIKMESCVAAVHKILHYISIATISVCQGVILMWRRDFSSNSCAS